MNGLAASCIIATLWARQTQKKKSHALGWSARVHFVSVAMVHTLPSAPGLATHLSVSAEPTGYAPRVAQASDTTLSLLGFHASPVMFLLFPSCSCWFAQKVTCFGAGFGALQGCVESLVATARTR